MMDTTLSHKQLSLLWHTLGVSATLREPYRNFFHASAEHPDYPQLQALAASGHMKVVRRPGFLCEDAILFVATEQGISTALSQLPEEKKPSKYEGYLRQDGYFSFSEYLGITLPELEYNRGLYRYTRRKMRHDYSVELIQGQWCPTKKAAKSSYKESLLAARTPHGVHPV